MKKKSVYITGIITVLCLLSIASLLIVAFYYRMQNIRLTRQTWEEGAHLRQRLCLSPFRSQ